MKKLWKAVIITAVTAYLLTAGQGCTLLRQAPEEGDGSVITFSLPELFTGEEVTFPDDFEDQVVYLIYFANG